MAAEAVLGGGVQQIYEQLRGAGNDKGQEESSTIEPKEFFWDQFLKYISTAIVALSVFHVSVALLHGGGVVCFPPSDTRSLRMPEENDYTFSRSQSDYVNSYCSRSVPISEYFPIYLLVHGLLLIAPHYVWGALFKGDFDSFYAIAERFDRLRDSKTGEYDPKNFDRVQKLELEYGGINHTIFQSYIVKLVLQVLACVGSIIFSQTFFIDFSFSFNCPKNMTEKDIPPDWPLNTSVLCVFTTLRVLNLVRYADYILIGAATLLILWGLLWCIVRHTAQLGSVEIANFAFQSCLAPDSFAFPHILSWPKCPCFSKRCCTCRYPRISLHNFISPRIKNDLDFLLMCLFRADSSHGKVFKDIQINKELKRLIGRDHQLLHLYVNVQQDMATKGEIPEDEEDELTEEDLADGGSDVLDHKTIGCCERFCQLFRRVQRSRIHSANQQESMQDDSEDATCSCCGRLREMCQRAFSTSRNSRPPLKRQNTKYGAISDFKDYFRDAGFTTNPEHHAYHYFKPYLGNTEWHPVQGIRDRLYGFVQFCPKMYDPHTNQIRPNTYMAVDLSFGSIGYALVLARPFKVVVSMNFHPFYRNDKEVVKKEEFYTNYITVKFPANIFAQKQANLNKANEETINFIVNMKRNNQAKPPINFIVVGPISEEAQRITVNLAINLLQTAKLIEEGAILLAIRPLRVGHKKVTQRFFEYEPAKQQFDELPDAREKLKKEIGLKWVDGISGVRVQCGNIPCVFEFVTYKYKPSSNNPTDASSMPLEEPDNGAAVAQPKNGAETAENWTEEETPSPDLAYPDTQWFVEVKGKPQHLPTPRQPGTRSPTRFIPLDNGSPRKPVNFSNSNAAFTTFSPTASHPRPRDSKNGPRVLRFESHTHSIATTTTATLTSSTSPVHTPTDSKETVPIMQTTPTTQFRAIIATNGSIQSTEDTLPSIRCSTSSDLEPSQTSLDQLPNKDVVTLQLDTDVLRPKPKSPVQRDNLSPTSSLGSPLNAQNYPSSGTPPLRMRRKPDKNFPVTPQGATQPSNTRNYRSNDRESRSQMSLDVNDLLELLPTTGGEDDNSSVVRNNDAAAASIHGHTVDNKATPEEGSKHSTEV